MVDTTTFAAIMTKNGHDQQQTMPVCFICVMGWRSCIFCVWLLSLLPLLLWFSYFWPRTQHGRHDNICCVHDHSWSWPAANNACLFIYVVGWSSFIFCVWLLSLLPLSPWFSHFWPQTQHGWHDNICCWSRLLVMISSKQTKKTRGIHRGCIHVFTRLIVAFVVFVVAPCVFLAVETTATRQQVLLRSSPKNARIHSKWGLAF